MAAIDPNYPLSNRHEMAYVPVNMEELIDLRNRLIVEVGARPDVASAVIGWLLDKKYNNVDELSQTTRSKYRKLLARVEPFDPQGPGRKAPKQSKDLGAAFAGMFPGSVAAINAHFAESSRW